MGGVRQTAEDAGLRGFFCLLPGLVEPSNLAPHPLLSFSRKMGRRLYGETVLDKCTEKGVGGIYFWDSDKNICSHYHVAFGGAMTVKELMALMVECGLLEVTKLHWTEQGFVPEDTFIEGDTAGVMQLVELALDKQRQEIASAVEKMGIIGYGTLAMGHAIREKKWEEFINQTKQ